MIYGLEAKVRLKSGFTIIFEPWGPLPGVPGALAPQFLEKINEFLKFIIDFFNNFDALAPRFKPVADSLI